jgi:hypothetical protein
MLQTLSEDGQLSWQCQCGAGNHAHISHEALHYPPYHWIPEWRATGFSDEQIAELVIRAIMPHTTTTAVALPPCETCGSRVFLNTCFSERELAPPVVTTTIIDSRVPKEGIVRVEYPEGASVNLNTVRYHLEKFTVGDGAGSREDIIFPVFDGIMQHPAVTLHRQLAEQMAAIGKVPPSQQGAPSAAALRGMP